MESTLEMCKSPTDNVKSPTNITRKNTAGLSMLSPRTSGTGYMSKRNGKNAASLGHQTLINMVRDPQNPTVNF
jgi:hypothetical protein